MHIQPYIVHTDDGQRCSPEPPALGAGLDLELVTENLQNFREIPLTSDVQLQPQLPALGNKFLINNFALPKMES